MTNNIFKLLENKNVKNIKISDGNLQLINSYSYDAITYKFLEECFNDYFNDSNNNEPHELLNFIKTKRNRTTVNSIKEFIIKNYKYIYIMNNNTLYNLRKEIFNNKRFDNITSIPGYNFINYNDNIKSNIILL